MQWHICRFEETVADQVRSREDLGGLDGVVCGHIHHAQMRTINGVLYLNDGDWVESCTALVEDARGNLEILRWAATADAQEPASSSPVPGAIPFPA